MFGRILAFSLVASLFVAGCRPLGHDSGLTSKDKVDAALDQLQTAAAAGNMKRAQALAHKLLTDRSTVDDCIAVEEAFVRGGQPVAGAAVLERASRQFPELETERKVELFDLMASDYYTGGDNTNARRIYEQALGIAPTSDRIQNDYAYFIAEYGGDMKRALAMARFAYSKAPKKGTTQDTYGWVLFKSGDVKAALPLLAKAAASMGTNPEVQYHLAQVYETAGRKAEAVAAYQKSLKYKASSTAINSRALAAIKSKALARLRVLDLKAYAEATKLEEPATPDKKSPLSQSLPFDSSAGGAAPLPDGK